MKLLSGDGIEFTIDLEVAKWSCGVFMCMGDFCENDTTCDGQEPIALENIRGEILGKLIKWINHNYELKNAAKMMEWNAAFLMGIKFPTLCEVAVGAHFLDIKDLHQVCINSIVSKTNGKGSPEMRRLFGLSETHQNSGTDRMKLMTMLPEEIWLVVLGLVDKDSLYHVLNCALYFRELRDKERTLDLFHKVFPVIAVKFEERKFCEKNGGGQLVEETHFKPKEWRHTALQLRLVCSKWNKVVESSYEDGHMMKLCEHIEKLGPTSPMKFMRPPIWVKNKFSSYDNEVDVPRKFVEHFKHTHGSVKSSKNPFISRSLDITLMFNGRDQDRVFIESLIRMLTQFGNFVLYCNLGFCVIEGAWETPVVDIGNILRLLPNLKHLEIYQYLKLEQSTTYKLSTIRPFPTLNNLKALVVTNVHGSILTEFIMQNGHVRSLTINECDFEPEVGIYLGNLERFVSNSSIVGELLMMRFGHCWKLKECSLSRKPLLVGSVAFQFLRDTWASSLVYLRIQDYMSNSPDALLIESRHSRINAPNLVHVVILSEHSFYLDFLLSTRDSLQHLQLFDLSQRAGIYYQRVLENQTIQVYGFEKDMSASNIWNMFPKLKTVKLVSCPKEFVIFTRDGRKLLYSN